MRKIIGSLVVLISINAGVVSAQSSTDQEAITKVIAQLFKGMEKADSAMVRPLFAKEVTMATVFRNKNNETVLHRETSIEGFLKSIGTSRKEVLYEEIWNLKIQVDGDFAQAWCDYAFYIDNTFSHCGVDAFQFVRDKEGWKIFHLADTRRKQGCDIPKNIQDKHK